jgi:exonuclease SbcC
MIPIRLELKNFLAYKSPAPLDFTGIHVAVLVGENGAGKSSLLDAITWALWGEARAKTDNELVHTGQTEMRVEFTFALGEQLYRVTRAKRAGKAAGGLLDLHLLREDGKWASVGEATIPKTQAKINQVLRLKYDTFVNSAYLKQGKADEFTSKPPNRRKEVLADILGLQEWEKYEERAKLKIRALDQQLAGLEMVLTEIENELGRRAEYEREVTTAQARVIAVGERLRQAEAEWSQIEAARQAMVSLQKQIDDLSRRVGDTEKEIAALDGDLRETQARSDTTTLLKDMDQARERLRELEAMEAERDRAAEARQQMAELAASLRGQNDSAESEGNALKKRAEAAATEAHQQAQRVAETARFETVRVQQRLAALETATDPRCPTCGQPLSDEQRAQLLAELAAELETRQARMQAELAEIEARRAQTVTELNDAVEARREQYRQNKDQLKQLQDDQAVLEKSIQRFAADLRAKPVLAQRLGELQTALAQAGQAQERIAGLLERRARWAAALEADAAQRRALETEADRYVAALREAPAKQRALDQLRQEDTLTKARLGAAQQKLDSLDMLAQQRQARRAERQTLAEQRGVYDELREAFGKKGVPALMIEAAVPEIEAAANQLLGRMTDGRMHLRFNMQRETQAGETRETLDIQIADELGTRAYEMYSGGEAFRVNFAIRIALSQLLARRAGTQLQTLIVDEGFGVLDAVGRERLVDAIRQVEGDFQRILVVTHIDELKDAFPARIEITKGPDGSEIAVA